MLNKHRMFYKSLAASFSLAALAALTPAAAMAQSTKSCAAPASAVNSLAIEQVLDLSRVLSVQTPPAPAGVLNGTQEIHQTFILDPQTATINSATFVVAKGSPVPTNPAAITAANTLQTSTVRINQVLAGSAPAPSLMIVGTLINSPPGGFPSSVGTPVVITMGYTSLGWDEYNQVNNFALIVAGQVIAWTPTASGYLGLGYPPPDTVPAYCSGS